jgi:hypothetical protein
VTCFGKGLLASFLSLFLGRKNSKIRTLYHVKLKLLLRSSPRKVIFLVEKRGCTEDDAIRERYSGICFLGWL